MTLSGDHEGRRTAARFFGVLLIVGGALMAALCGLCTLLFVGVGVSGGGQSGSGSGFVELALILGGVPTVFGGLMIWGGIVLVRGARKRSDKVTPDTFD